MACFALVGVYTDYRIGKKDIRQSSSLFSELVDSKEPIQELSGMYWNGQVFIC